MGSMKTFEVRYEDGVLKPAKPLPLTPGENIAVILVRPDDPRLKNLERFVATHAEELDYLTEAGLQEWVEMLDKIDKEGPI